MLHKPFVVSVRMIIHDNVGKYLLLRRSAINKSGVGKWEFPGGKINPGEEFYDALIREVEEETGLKVNVEHVIGVTESETSTVKIATLIFEGTRVVGQVTLSNEHDAYEWVTPKKLPKYDLIAHLQSFVNARYS